jgi:uncharacterized protein
MEFEWDPRKEAANVKKHDSTKPEHGEERSLAIGLVAGRLAAVVYTDRAERRRIISARSARKNERERYDQSKATA